MFGLTPCARYRRPAGLSAIDAAQEWQAFFATWTAWNHVRTGASVIAAVLMVIGLRDN